MSEVVPVPDAAAAPRRCAYCGGPVEPDDRICPSCHRPLVRQWAVVAEGAVGAVPSPPQHFPPGKAEAGVRTGPGDAVETAAAWAPDVRWGRYRRTVALNAPLTLGSASPANVVVPATFLEPIHVALVPAANGWRIERRAPLGTLMVRGLAVDAADLEGGQVIRLGDRVGNFITMSVLQQRASLVSGGLRGPLPVAGGRLTIGRAASADICLDHSMVRGEHAEIERTADGTVWLVDRSRGSGTYVNGERAVGRRCLADGDAIQIGPFSARVQANRLVEIDQGSGIAVRVEGASVYARGTAAGPGGRRALLREVALDLPAASFTAIVGVSGAGKSTLARLLSGQTRSQQEGQVLYNDLNLAQHFAAFAPVMGFVPQDDIVHTDLTVQEALAYQARLRLPSDMTPTDRAARITRVLSAVGLRERAAQPVRTLSGGQRKRVSIASELLNDPAILFLDEPTSGLDPGLDKRMMFLLRLLADQGHTIVLITHNIAHVDLCDQLVIVAPGGYIVYSGEPGLVTEHFGVETLGDVFLAIDTPEAAAAAAGRLAPAVRGVPAAVPSTGPARPEPGAAPPAGPSESERPAPGTPAWRQLVLRQAAIFAGRQMRLFARDRTGFAFAVLQGIGIALLTAVVAPRPLTWGSPMFVLACAAVWLGTLNAVREIVKERAIWQRERRAGALTPAYLGAKVAVLVMLSVFQAASMVVTIHATIGLPVRDGMGPPGVDMVVTLWLASVSGVTVGLLLSAVMPSADRAMAVVPYVLIPQLVLSGVLFKLRAMTPVSYLIGARWAVSALGGIAGLHAKTLHQTPGLYPHGAVGLFGDWFALLLLSAAATAVTWRSLERRS